jgi:hypothetical protein
MERNQSHSGKKARQTPTEGAFSGSGGGSWKEAVPSPMGERGDANSDVPAALTFTLDHQSSEIPMSANCLTGSQDEVSIMT